MCEEEEGPQEGVRLILEPHAAPDIQPFVVEPQQAVSGIEVCAPCLLFTTAYLRSAIARVAEGAGVVSG
jgi:hypothetical protein